MGKFCWTSDMFLLAVVLVSFFVTDYISSHITMTQLDYVVSNISMCLMMVSLYVGYMDNNL